MPSRGLPTVPARHSLCGGDQVQMPAIEPTTSSCEIAWRGRLLSRHQEHPLQRRKRTCRALIGARLSQLKEGRAPRAETGTIAHSCANVWQAKFADLNSPHRNKKPALARVRAGKQGGCHSAELRSRRSISVRGSPLRSSQPYHQDGSAVEQG